MQSSDAVRHVTGSHGTHGYGMWSNGRFLHPASVARRWWARVLDALFVLLLALTATVAAFSLYEAGAVGLDAATAVALLSYPVALLVLGALYGCTVSPGQALTGVVSLRQPRGDRVGFWRGMVRYLGVGLFPLALVLLIFWLLDSGDIDSARIAVYRR